jgi:hypothetical protein
MLIRGEARQLLSDYLFARGQDPRTALTEVKGGLESSFYIRFQGTDFDRRHLRAFLIGIEEANTSVSFKLGREDYVALRERTGNILADEFDARVSGHGLFKGKTYTIEISRDGARLAAKILDSSGYREAAETIRTALDPRRTASVGATTPAAAPPISRLSDPTAAPAASVSQPGPDLSMSP